MDLNNNKPLAIIGGSDSGKTNFAIYAARATTHNKRYLLGYPKDIEGFLRIQDIGELYQCSNCVVIIDEFQRYFNRNGRHANEALQELLDFAEHGKVKLILTAQNNQAIDRNTESRIKQWALKRINTMTLKQGGMCKNALKSIKDHRVSERRLALKPQEVLFYDIDSGIGGNGIFTFPFQNIGKDWTFANTQDN